MATTAQLANDGNTVDLWHLDGATSSAAKLNGENGNDLSDGATAPTASVGQIVPTTDGASNFTGAANKYHTLGDLASMPTGDFTIEFWMKPAGSPSDTQGVITKYGTVATRSFYIQRDTDNKLTFAVSLLGTVFVSVTSATALVNGDWYYIACVFTAGSKLEIYINGASNATNTTGIPASILDGTSAIDFGAYEAFRATAANVYNGDLDEVRLSNIVRTASEISLYYNAAAIIGSSVPGVAIAQRIKVSSY